MSISFQFILVILSLFVNHDIAISILPRSQHISCWLVLFDAWMKVLATPSSLLLIFKKGYYILAEAITLLSICIRIAHKSFETLGRAVVVLMLWLLPTGKQICRSFCHFWKNVGSNYLTRRIYMNNECSSYF